MGWQVVFVDNSGRTRNGGRSLTKGGSTVEVEARERAEKHNSLVSNRADKVHSFVCVKTTD